MFQITPPVPQVKSFLEHWAKEPFCYYHEWIDLIVRLYSIRQSHVQSHNRGDYRLPPVCLTGDSVRRRRHVSFPSEGRGQAAGPVREQNIEPLFLLPV